jgi:hexosaminidase
MMLDVSRHFFNVAEVKKVIELMAAYKLNNFHWHLVDGQGWRIEIKKYPKLTQVGGYRMQTMFGSNRDWPDQLSYCGY